MLNAANRKSRLLEYRSACADALNKSLKIFVSYTEKAIDDVMSNGLHPVADVASVDRIIVFRIHGVESNTAGEIYRWDKAEGGTAPIDPVLKLMPVTGVLKRWVSIMSNDTCISLKRSEFTEEEAAFLSPRGVQSILIVPVFTERELWGIITFHDNTNERDFDEDCTRMLRSTARLCASTIIRDEKTKSADYVIEKLKHREECMSLLNKAAVFFLSQSNKPVEIMMSEGIRQIFDIINIDRFSIFRYFAAPENSYASQIYRWERVAGGFTQPNKDFSDVSYAQYAPSWEFIFAEGKTINGPVHIMPEPESAMLKSIGAVSVFATPVFINDIFWGFTFFEDHHNERCFDENHVELMQSTAFLCVNTIIKSETEHAIKEAEALKYNREADERIQIIFDTAPIGCLMYDKDFNFFDCNQETMKMLKLPNKKMFLERFFELSPEYQPCGRKSSDMVFENKDKTFSEGYSRFEWMHQTLNREPIPCEITQVRVKYKDEYVITAYIRDLREHKVLLDEIHNENERFKIMAHWYESVLDSIPFIISVQDINKNWTYINAAAEAFLGRNLDEIVGTPCKNWGLSICDTEYCAIECANRGHMRTHFLFEDESFQVDTKILKDLNNDTTGYIEVIQDITKMEHMAKQQAEAEAANIAKSSFLSAMSHEMRTPMNAIIGMAAIGKNAADIKRKNYALNRIEEASTHLLGVINDVLDMSKIEANKLELSHIAFNLKHSLHKAVVLVQFGIEEKQLQFFIKIADNIPSFFIGDDQRLTQVITNLLSNAIKFTPKEGNISFEVSLTGEKDEICELRFEVADSGIGIAPEQQEKIFNPFEQAESGTTRKFGGTGLGLVISKRIIELMNGRIWVESELGKGARFIFTAKLLRDDQETNSQPGFDGGRDEVSAETLSDEFKGKKILVVEDIEINREILISLLDGTGLTIDTAENGKEAVDMVMADPEKYDLIFMDIQMPVMDGLEAAGHIRALPAIRNKKLPIIAMTANVFQEDIDKCHAAGMDDHIGKPLDMTNVFKKLREYL